MKVNEMKFVNFTLERSDNTLLENLDFKIENDKYNLVGKNGIGKSSLLDCLFKINTKYLGDIYLDDINLKKISVKDLRGKYIGYVNQEVILLDNLSIEENIGLFQKDKNFSKVIFDSIESDLKLNLKRKINTLSGGEKQYVNILLNIVHDKPILLIDEPFNNLSKNKIASILDMFNRSEKFILCVTHQKVKFKEIKVSKRKLEYV